MDWETFCNGKADECDSRADETIDVESRARWFQMARDWRVAASRPEPPRARDDPA
jgi:hypothetical protein